MSDPEEPVPALPEEPVLAFTPGPLVLVVADDRTHRSIVSRMVRTLGFPVRNCPGSPAALQFLREHPREVKLLLADLALSRIDGGELAERARDLDPELRVVLMASGDDAHVDDLIAGYRDWPFVAKPVSFGELAEALYGQLGMPVKELAEPPSMQRTRRRRSSGQHRV